MIGQDYKIDNVLREIVVKTNPVWPFSILNKMPYRFAINCFVRECSKFSEVKSVYLRGSLAEKRWTAGLSDIDWTIIINGNLSAEKEFSFLLSFWRDYERLKKLFPMLGEVEVLDDRLITTWTKFGIRGYESKFWKLLHGTETAGNNYAEDPERLVIDALNYAFKFYRISFLLEFFKQSRASPELRRLASKILKYSDYGNDNGGLDKGMKSYDKEDILCCIIIKLDRCVKSLYGNLVKSNGVLSTKGNVNSFANTTSREIREKCTAALSLCCGAIESILLVPAVLIRPMVVLRDGLSLSAMRTCVDSILKTFGDRNKPILLTPSLFDYTLRVENPLRYREIIKIARTFYGRDLISEMRPPDEHFFIKSAVEQSMHIFNYFRSKTMVSSSSVDGSVNKHLRNRLRMALSAKLCLEKKEFIPDLDELCNKYKEFYPGYYEKIIKLRENGSSWERYMLMRDLANDVHKSILGLMETV